MKLHRPATEAALRQAIARERGGRGMGRDGASAWKMTRHCFRDLFIKGALVAMLAVMLGAGQPQFAQPGWRQFVVGWWFTFAALYSSNILRTTAFGSPTSFALQNLPVRGEFILSWARAQTLRKTWIVFAAGCVAGWVLHGQRLEMAVLPRILSYALALWLMTLATAISLSQPWVRRCRLDRLWGWMCLGSAAVIGIAFFARGSSIAWLHLERAIEPVAPLLSWLMPPAWVGGELFSWQAAAASLVWSLLGVLWWLRWPQAQGWVLDAPRDVIAEDEIEEEEHDDDIHQQGAQNSLRGSGGTDAPSVGAEVPAPPSLKARLFAESAAPDLPPKGGWIERLAWRFLSARDRRLAAMFMPRDPGWSVLWNKAARFSVMLVALMFAARVTLPESAIESATLWLLLAQGVLLLVHAVPISNQLHIAFAPYWTSGQRMPFFAGLPVNARDLLRFSNRITWARTLAALPLVVSAFALSTFALGMKGPEIWMSAKASAATLLALAVQRPLVVAFRLQESAKRVRGFTLGFLAALVTVPLALADLFGAFLAVLAQFGEVLPDSRGSELIAAGALVGCVLVNRAIFEIYRQFALRGCVDLLKQV
jgi:hypothetical protein